MGNFPTNPNGFPTAPPSMQGGGAPQQDPIGPFTQRLESSLNKSIGVRGKDTEPDKQAQFDLQNDPQNAMAYAKTVMQAIQQRMMAARQQAMMRMQSQVAPMTPNGFAAGAQAPQPEQPQQMAQGMPQ